MSRIRTLLYIIALACLLGGAFSMSTCVYAAEDNASLYETTATELTQDAEAYTFSNASDGSFKYTYAKNEDYFLGYALDESTGIKYAFITYEDELWAVVMSSKSEYNGSYNCASYKALGSSVFNKVTTETHLTIKSNSTGNEYLEDKFFYSDDYSIITTGFSKGKYYINNVKANGIKLVDDVYYFFKKGKQITKKGWYTYKGREIYVAKSGEVKYAFNGVSCYKYTGGQKKKVVSKTISINGISYTFDSNGALAQGLVTVGEDYYYYVDGLIKTDYYKKVDGYYYYFGSDGAAVKGEWVTYKKRDLYFNKSAHNTKIFFHTDYKDTSKAGKYKVYKSGKWSYMITGIYKINGEFKYIKDGTVYTGTAWYNYSDTISYYVLKGVVTYKLKCVDGVYKLYTANGTTWTRAKDTWSPAKKGQLLYFNEKGVVTEKYFNSKYKTTAYRQTVWKYNDTKGKWVRQKSKILKVNGYYYYADENGTLVTTKGWLTLSDTSAIYISKSGHVTKHVYYSESKGYSIYLAGKSLTKKKSGVYTATINSKQVYYYMDSDGHSVSGEVTVGGYSYVFDEYGMTTSRRREGSLYWDTDSWLARVILAYLGNTGVSCNTFVYNAINLAGTTDETITLGVKYGSVSLNTTYTCSAWGGSTDVVANMILSDGTSWQEADDYILNEDITDFSYADLTPGDVIVYYKSGETTSSHVAIFLGQFDSADDVIDYLVELGVSSTNASAYVKNWGQYYGNDSKYWVIQGGMGSSSQVYICNSAYCIPASGGYTYAKKIVNVAD